MSGPRTLRLLPPLLAISMASTVARAAEDEVAQEQMPDLQFLEFLGQWETDEGEWIPPDQLADGEFAQLLDAAAQNPPENDSTDDDNDAQANG